MAPRLIPWVALKPTLKEAPAAKLVPQSLPLKVVRDSCDSGREIYQARLILVRPDQYVAWCGNEGPADTPALMRKIAGLD